MLIINDVKDVTGLLIDEPVFKNISKAIEITKDEFYKLSREYDEYIRVTESFNNDEYAPNYLLKSTKEYFGFELLVLNVNERFFKIFV